MIENKLIAHRGWQRQFPENTLLSVNEALKIGAKHIEIDIQLTADEVPVLCHDQHLQRVSNVTGNINFLSLNQLSSLNSYEPQRFGKRFIKNPFSSLSECVDLIAKYNDVTLYVEIKEESLKTFGHERMVSAVLPLLEKIKSQCIVISFDIEILQLFNRYHWLRVAPVLSNWQQAFSLEIKNLQPILLFCDIKLFTAEYTPLELPYLCAIYEINSYSQAQQLLKQGAALIESFAIGELINEDRANVKSLN